MLVRAGILASVPGPHGGFHLASKPENITALDIVLAIEGLDPAFRWGAVLGHVPEAGSQESFARTCLV